MATTSILHYVDQVAFLKENLNTTLAFKDPSSAIQLFAIACICQIHLNLLNMECNTSCYLTPSHCLSLTSYQPMLQSVYYIKTKPLGSIAVSILG